MRLSDHLELFTVEDLRELAARRQIRVSPGAMKGRQTLVRTLSASLERSEGVYAAVSQLDSAELAVLLWTLKEGRKASLTRLVEVTGLPQDVARAILDSLRLWGLLFPEGSWDHIAIPNQTRTVQHYVYAPLQKRLESQMRSLMPPEYETVKGVTVSARQGDFARDVAEFLARLARSRMKLTQAGRMNRRDLKGMSGAFPVSTSGYPFFLGPLLGSLGLLAAAPDGVLVVPDSAEGWLIQPAPVRLSSSLMAWQVMRAYPETAHEEPADAEYVPQLLPAVRMAAAQTLAGVPEGTTTTVKSFARTLEWHVPFAFAEWSVSRDPGPAAARIARSLYWLGLAAVDDPENPRHLAPSPLYRSLISWNPQTPGDFVPDEPQFFLQPNAEIFAPPNLSPRALFHLRRFTGETKNGAAGMYPITADSLRKAFDSGLSPGEVVRFLERFSRTGLPDNVRKMVETSGRQHGRIRLVPAGYVLVTDTADLMKELRSIKLFDPLVGTELTERAAQVDVNLLPELMRKLRSKGYAPVDMAETVAGPPLPDDPHTPAPELVPAGLANLPPSDDPLEWLAMLDALAEDETGIALAPGLPITEPAAIRSLLEEAITEGYEVEMEYHGETGDGPTVRTIQPWELHGKKLNAFCCLRGDERNFNLDRIVWARLTGETFDDESF